MKKIYQVTILSLGLLAVNASSALNNLSGTSISYASAQRVNLGVNTTNAAYKEGTFTLNQNAALRDQTLQEIRNIRSRLWDENIYFTNNKSNSKGERLQDVAKANGYSSKEAYVNGITWSSDLEKIAIQRAYEQVSFEFSHDRPDGTDFQSAVTASGVKADGENLASNTQPQSPALAFAQWSFRPSKNKNNKSEYDLLIEAKGVTNAENGHLHHILDPDFGQIGFAVVSDPNSKWKYGVAEFGFNKAKGDGLSANLVGDYILYIGKAPANTKASEPSKSYKKPTDDEVARLKTTVANAKTTINAAELLIKTMPNFASRNGGKLQKLIDTQLKLIKEAETLISLA